MKGRSRTMKRLTLKVVENESLWVAKTDAENKIGTFEQVAQIAHDECCEIEIVSAEHQPEFLQEFYRQYEAYCKSHDWTLPQIFYTKVWSKKHPAWTAEEIKNLIQTDDRVLYKALKKLYAEQTSSEQRVGETRERNGVGFNGPDSYFLSSVAEFLIRKGFLIDKQKAVTRRKLAKYTGQLTKLANA